MFSDLILRIPMDSQRSGFQMFSECWTIFVRYSDGSAKLTLSTIVKHLILVTHKLMTL